MALIAHDNLKYPLAQFVADHREFFKDLKMYATGTTAKLLQDKTGLNIHAVASGPLGGDLQIGSLIVEDQVDAMIFLWDPMSPHPHDVDVKALLRIAVLKNIPMACNLATANALIKT
jgi:methylglyoxal synthase